MRDRTGREITYMRLSVTDLCNLRCRYCMPEEGVDKKAHCSMLTEDEMIMAVRVAASMGVRKLRITGGEPLVKKNIVNICSRAAAVPGIGEVDLTTNGILLPELGAELRRAGVSRLNISLDTLDPEKYTYMSRIGSLDKALAGIEAGLAAGFDKIKINAVLIGGFNDDEIEALAGLTMKMPVDMRFIELMPMTEGEFGRQAFIPCGEVLKRLPELEPVETRDGGVARLYRLPGALGNVGLISPLSSHFCGECSRIRLTADGKLMPCLHSALEFGIKGLTEEEMRQQYIRAVEAKPERHGELSYDHMTEAARTMNRIGG